MPVAGAVLYGLTTPIGIAVGLGVRTSYNPDSTTASIVSGVLDSFSAGILVYTGLVEVISFFLIAPTAAYANPLALRPRILIQQGDDECLKWKTRLRPRLDVSWLCFNGSPREMGLKRSGTTLPTKFNLRIADFPWSSPSLCSRIYSTTYAA